MATTSSSSRRKLVPRRADQREDEPLVPRRRFFLRGALATLLVLAVVGWFAPTIVASTGLLNRVIAWATSDLQGSLTVGSASLGWLSPVELHDVELRDREGELVLSAPSVASQRSLAGLARNLDDLGEFRCDRPKLRLVLRDGGSNLEEVLAEWLKPKDEPSPRVGFGLTIEGADVHVRDTVGRRDWQVKDIHVSLASPRDAGSPLVLDATGAVPVEQAEARFAAKVSVTLPESTVEAKSLGAIDLGSGEADVTISAFPLALVQSLVRRFAPDAQLAGQLDAQLKGNWGRDAAGQPRAQLAGNAVAQRLILAGAGLGDDQVRLARLDIPYRLARHGNRLDVEQFDVVSDVGQLASHGTVDGLDKIDAQDVAAGCVRALSQASGSVDGRLDLSRVAALLPRTLHIREGTQIRSGEATIRLASEPHAEGRTFTGQIETTPLVATSAGREFSWEHPLQVSLAGRSTAAGPVVDRLEGQSEFLNFNGAGTLDSFELNARYDLDKLASELSRFVDLGEVRMAGDGQSHVTFKRDASNRFEANARVDAQNFELTRPGAPAWTEQRLVVSAAASGMLAGTTLQRVDTALFQVESGQDQMVAQVKSPVDRPNEKTKWPVELRLQGQIARWLARAEPWIGSPGEWQLDGQANLIADAACSLDQVDIASSQLDVERLHVWGSGLYVDEPQVRATAAARWTRDPGRVEIRNATLATSALSAQTKGATLSLGEATTLERINDIAFRGDLAGLYRWVSDPAQHPNWRVAGRCEGRLNVEQAGPATTASVNATVDDLVATPTSGEPWREKQMRLVGRATYDRHADRLELASLDVTSQMLRMNAAGNITRVSAERNIELAGKLDYDLAQVTQLLKPYVGEGVRLAGRESRRFNLSGPLASATGVAPQDATLLANLKGQADFGWQSADLYGAKLGPADLKAQLADGLLRVSPLKLNVNEGLVTIAPTVRVSPAPYELSMPAGPLAEKVNITPEMCERGLMYVLPALAGVTQAQGQFSIDLEGCRLPLADMKTGDAAGTFTVHSVEIGPGPLIRELATLLGDGSPQLARLTRESQVPFRMVEGRIYHQNVGLEFRNVTIRTYGSVGLDKTLAVIAEIPITEKMLRGAKLPEALKNRTIKIPVGGTLNQPQPDTRALAELTKQFLLDTGQDLLRNQLNKQLDRLLPLAPRAQ